MSKTEGAFADPHLEVWIDICAWMSNAARLWACGMLLARQTAALGGPGAEPYSCQPGFGIDDGLSMADRIMRYYAEQASGKVKASGATPEQQNQVSECLKAVLVAALKPSTLERHAECELSGRDREITGRARQFPAPQTPYDAEFAACGERIASAARDG